METIFTEKDGRKRKGINLICKECKKDFIGQARKPYKFCSPKCSQENRKKRNVIECAFCNKHFSLVQSKLKNSKSGFRFCSRRCKDSAQRIGGIKEIMPDHYGTSKKCDKTLIENTQNPQCCDCNEDRRYLLCVHHKDGNRKHNETENLEIVCASCHMKRHLKLVNGEWIYNTKVLTPRELLEDL